MRRQEPPGPSLPGGCGCLRKDRRATAIVTAAASTARPMTWPPMSRTSSGRPAERSIALVEGRWPAAPAPAPGAAEGDGDTCGKAEPRLPVGWMPRPGTVPVGRSVVGIVVPSPAFCVGDVDELPPEDFRLMSTVADADAEFDASADVADAVSVTWC